MEPLSILRHRSFDPPSNRRFSEGYNWTATADFSLFGSAGHSRLLFRPSVSAGHWTVATGERNRTRTTVFLLLCSLLPPAIEMAEITVSKSKQQWQVEELVRNWLELPSDVTANILYRVGVIDILENAQKVCTTWRKICKDPAMWRVIHMNDQTLVPYLQKMEMCKHAVDRSQGQLVDISIVGFADDELLWYVANRSSQLKQLKLSSHFGIHGNWTQALKKFPYLEELNLDRTKISKEAIETAGRCCPMLKTLKLNREMCRFLNIGTNEKSLRIRNETAKAIGENLLGLTHLELIGNNMTNIGLQAILDGCGYLESLDLRQCMYIDLKGEMEKKCTEKIKCLKLPEDSLEECMFFNSNDCTICELAEIESWIFDDCVAVSPNNSASTSTLDSKDVWVFDESMPSNPSYYAGEMVAFDKRNHSE
ncbi:hypothetical protein L2E82_22446 [Cichorium intybus]|uniref:Uncharacterized protein n=1 Tax=Cichorium intybus TaxID=13427 RepID=A0ACB9DYR4_CICIN|nr:hypothetical protein L2E82_22446 [Cichorium intybus]